jgi:CHAT domain-containing protein/tetratricopeptide (TPR) repeat protein
LLEPGKPVERELSGGQSHSYKVTMISGQYLRVVVAQRGIDVAVALFAPDGKKISEENIRTLIDRSEIASAIAEAPGAYLIEVRSPEKTARTGRYEIKVEELRTATVDDKYSVAAKSAFLEAKRLHNGSLEAKIHSIEKYNEAVELYRRSGERNWEADAVNNIGLVYSLLGEMQKAMEKFNESLPISREIGDRRGEGVTLHNIGAVYWSLGEPQKALEKLNESLPIRRAAGDRSGEAGTINYIGVVYWSLGEPQKALEKFNESLPISREAGDRSVEAATLTNIGTVYYRSLGETQKALEKLNQALTIRRAAGDRRGEAQVLNNIGTAYRLSGEMKMALEKYNEALTSWRAVDDRSGVAATINNIGIVYLSLGEPQKALELYNEALPIRRAVGDRSGEAATLLGIARAEQKRGNLTQARQTIERAISIVESVRASIGSQELRASFFASKQDFYESYIEVLMQMQKQNPAASFDALALAVSERARARSLLELLTEARADIRQGVDSSLLERERSLRQRFAARAASQVNILNRKHTPEEAEAAATEIASITSEYEEIQAQIRARSPRYAALTQPQPRSLAEIQQLVLDPDTLLLEYSLGENVSHLFAVSQTSITSHQLPKRAEIEAATRRVRELLTAPQPQPGDTEAKYQARVKESEESYWAQAAELSRMLLGPVASQLGKNRLAIVSDGALQYIPFAALPAPPPENDNGRNSAAEHQPLFVEHEIVSLPSASTLATLRRETAGRKPAEKSLAVLADPVFTDDDTRVRRDVGKAGAKEKTRFDNSDETDIGFQRMTRSGRETGVVGAEAGFGRLINTRREATAISALVPERERMQALDFEASRTTALRPELGEYRIVHFATHGLLNNIHPELSGIVLSLVDKEGQPQDGFLRLQDIFNLKLSAELVVLSACQTGLGKEIKGEGLIGLARGFMYAGAPRIVASLWKVDDQATSELMKRFYQGLLGPEALRPAAALRQAQLSIWKQKRWREPYYWAAFVLQGEWK